MAGEWENSQSLPQVNASNERERLRYLQLKAKAAKSAPQGDQIIEEMHPSMTGPSGTYQRLVVKNLGTNPEKMAAYLQKQNPNLEVKMGQNGRLLMRDKGSSGAYNVLDPDTGIISKDFARDLGDIGWDVAQGLGTGAATAASAVAAGLSSGGLLSLPVAVAAGSATEAGGEYARQKLGELAGIPEDMDPDLVKMSAIFGGASPLLFGTGAGVKQLGKAAIKKGLAPQAAEQLARSQSGIPIRAMRKVAPKIASMASGVDEGVIKNYYKNADEIKQLEKTGITPLAERTGKQFSEGIRKQRQRIGQDLQQVISESGEQIDIRPAKQAIKSKIAEMSEKSLDTPAEKAQLDELKNLYNEFFTTEIDIPGDPGSALINPKTGKPMKEAVAASKQVVDIPDFLDAEQALELQMRLKDPANLSRVQPNQMMARNAGKSLQNQQVENVASGAVADLSRQIDDTIESSVLSTLDNIEASDVKKLPRNLKDEYKNWSQTSRQFKNSFSDADKTYKTLTGIDAPTKQVQLEKIASVDKDLGLDTLENAQKLRAYRTFGKSPSNLPISAKGTVSTSRTIPLTSAGGAVGYYAGAQSGEGPGSGVIPGFVGASIGALSGSPRAIRFYMDMLRKAGPAKTPLVRSVRPTWMSLMREDAQQGE